MNNEYIVSNQVRCLKCWDTPFSMTQHDYRSCTCQEVTVDGGQAYLKRLGAKDKWKEMSITIDRGRLQPIIDEVARSMQTRNPLGVTLAALRAIRDAEVVPVKSPSGATQWMHEDDVPTLVLTPTPQVDVNSEYVLSLEQRVTKLQTQLDKIKKLF